MQVCLPVFKLELIWHPVGSRRAVGLPREMRRKQRGKTAAGQGPWLPPVSFTDTPTSAPRGTRGTRIQLQRRAGGGGGEGAASHWPGPAPKPRPLAIPGRACPVAWETGRRRCGCGWKALATPALAPPVGQLVAQGWARVKVQVPHTAPGLLGGSGGVETPKPKLLPGA